MKKVYSNILVLFSLFMIVFCMASCGSKTVFGTYVNDNNSNEYYTLKEDYTWESHKNSGTFTYVDGESKIDFTDDDGNSFSYSLTNYKTLIVKELDETTDMYYLCIYTKK